MLKGTFGDTKKESHVWIKKSCKSDQNRGGGKISIDFSFKAELTDTAVQKTTEELSENDFSYRFTRIYVGGGKIPQNLKIKCYLAFTSTS